MNREGHLPMPSVISSIRPITVAQPHPGESFGGRILVVDDDAIARAVMENRLTAHGHRVVCAEGPGPADAALAREEFDLILSDIHMPGNHRLEWIEALISRRCSAAILLMTGNPEMETACRAANLPVAGYIIKPVDWSVLTERIRQTISSRHRRSDFVGLAREILDLVENSGGGSQDEILVQRLAALAAGFMAGAGRPSQAPAGDQHWRTALTETIAVIEKTRDSFRSKELGLLRLRLEKLLA
jgi:DNA-binding response OmpR family regulator